MLRPPRKPHALVPEHHRFACRRPADDQTELGYRTLYFVLSVGDSPTRRLHQNSPALVAVAAIDATGDLVEENVTLPAAHPATLRVRVNGVEDVSDAVLVSLFLGDSKTVGTFLGMVSANGIDARTPAHTCKCCQCRMSPASPWLRADRR
jgi:hypothetical protein